MIEINLLIKEIKSLPPCEKRRNLLLDLVDNHKSPVIIPFLIKQIKAEKLSELDSTWVYACHEYSILESINYFDLFILIVIDSNFEAAWASVSLINDMRDYFDKISLTIFKKSYIKLRTVNDNHQNIELIRDVIFYIEEDIINPKHLGW